MSLKYKKHLVFNLNPCKFEELLVASRLPEAHVVFERTRDVFKKSDINPPHFLYGMHSIKDDQFFDSLTKNEYHLFSFLMELSLMDHIFRCYQMPEFVFGSSFALSISNGGFDKLVLKIFSGLSGPSKAIKAYQCVSGSKTMRSYKMLGKSLELENCLALANQKCRYNNINLTMHASAKARCNSHHPYKNALFLGFPPRETNRLIHNFEEKIH